MKLTETITKQHEIEIEEAELKTIIKEYVVNKLGQLKLSDITLKITLCHEEWDPPRGLDTETRYKACVKLTSINDVSMKTSEL